MRVLFLIAFLLIRFDASCQEIGLTLNSLRKQLDISVPEALKKVKEMGFKQIEFSSTYGLTFPEFIKQLAINDLSVAGFETTFERLEKFPQSAIDEARQYGAKYIVCTGIPMQEKIFATSDADHAALILNTAGKLISKNGLLLCYQPSGYEFQPASSGTLFDYFMQKLDIRYVHLKLDVFCVKQAGQDPVALLRKFPTRFVMIDLKDRKKDTPTSLDGIAVDDNSVVLGKGDANIAAVMKVAKELGIQQFLLDDQSPRAEQQIPKSMQFLKSLP